MLKINKTLVLLVIVLMAVCNKSFGQQHDRKRQIERTAAFHVFSKDSLEGFDEAAARRMAVSEQYLGAELNVKMYQMKRYYINDKYQLWPRFTPAGYSPDNVARTAVVPGCTNEDFEAAASGTIGSNNAIAGWALSSGDNSTPVGNATVNSCNLLGCCNGVTSESAIRTTPFIDPIIGTQYPIYSVFGTSTTNATAGAAANPQLTVPLFGNKVIRINDSVNDFSIEKLSKTFAVSASNALFQFAFISVFATGHNCCDAGSFRIRLYNASSGNTLIPCPTFSVAAPGVDCQAGPGTPDYLEAAASNPPNPVGGGSVSVNSAYIYNPWQISSIDLTQYIGSNITIEIILTDCTGGGHYGYCYFDAQCGPMTIYGNGSPFAAGNTTATVPTCGAAGATLCAASGLGPYSWAGPGVVAPYTTPSMANQCFTTNLSGTYTLYMNPAGSCAPITRVITSTVTPAPLLYASAVQAVCGSTTAVVTLTPAGSAASPSQITYTPAPLTYGGNSLTATYAIPSGTTPAYVVTVSATDPLGCYVSATTVINPAAPIPTFSIVNVTGSPSITCTHTLVELMAVTNYTYGSLTYSWNSQNTYSVTDDIGVYAAGTFTVVGIDPVSMCSVTHTYVVGINQTPPTLTLNPTFQNISCTTPVITVTASTTQTLNLTHNFITPGYNLSTSNNSVSVYQPGEPGVFKDSLVNNNNGCSVVKQFSVTSNDAFPSLSVSSPQNFTVGCGPAFNTATVNISGVVAGGGAGSYTVLTGPANNYTTNGVTTYSFATPGTYTAIIHDPSNGCETKIPFSIISNTATPNLQVNVPQTVLTCATPSEVLVAYSTNPSVGYTWQYPGTNGPASVATATFPVNTNTTTTNPALGSYTLTIKDNLNGCVSSTVITIRQNTYPPLVSITGGTSTISTSITCSTPSVNLNNSSHTGVPLASGFPTTGIISAVEWDAPSPQLPAFAVTNYTGYAVGVYTLHAMDQSNGCTATGTFSILDGRIYPVLTTTGVVLDCGTATNNIISVAATNGTTGLTYLWVMDTETNQHYTGTNTLSILHPLDAGVYRVVVTNSVNGCSSSATTQVVAGGLTANFAPSQISGYAPLTVIFTNNSTTGNNNNTGITTVWSFGNGTQFQSDSVTTSPSVVYNQPGTYTVTIFASKGQACQDTAVRYISVDIPSSLEIPNVFTPNGDNVNDIFFLKVSNMTEIHALIYDRWGHKVYELTSNTGNIAWDGKNDSTGKDAAAGVYFYVIKGTGKDNQDYNKKGSVTLYR